VGSVGFVANVKAPFSQHDTLGTPVIRIDDALNKASTLQLIDSARDRAFRQQQLFAQRRQPFARTIAELHEQPILRNGQAKLVERTPVAVVEQYVYVMDQAVDSQHVRHHALGTE